MRLIDADELMDELENEQPLNWTDSPGEIQEQADWERFKGMVSVANTIEAEPARHGEWRMFRDECVLLAECSECGTVQSGIAAAQWDYCPMCGCRMDGGADE